MKGDRLYLIHMRECMARIISYTASGQDNFMESTLIQDAVLRNLQTMAESSQRLSDDLKERYEDVDWTGLSGFRNVLVHDYLGVELTIVWRLVELELPKLSKQINDILGDVDAH